MPGTRFIYAIQETFVNLTDGHIIGETRWYEPFESDSGKLFLAMQREYGRCTSRVYAGNNGRAAGWTFQRTERYTDTGESYQREVWVTYCAILATRFVRDLQDERYTLITNSQDVEALNAEFHAEYSAFLIWTQDGDYVEVWGIEREIPYLDEPAYRIA